MVNGSNEGPFYLDAFATWSYITIEPAVATFKQSAEGIETIPPLLKQALIAVHQCERIMPGMTQSP